MWRSLTIDAYNMLKELTCGTLVSIVAVASSLLLHFAKTNKKQEMHD